MDAETTSRMRVDDQAIDPYAMTDGSAYRLPAVGTAEEIVAGVSAVIPPRKSVRLGRISQFAFVSVPHPRRPLPGRVFLAEFRSA